MHKEIGKYEQMTAQGLTLKELSERTNLPFNFLSHVERGLTSIDIVSLKNITKALNVEMTHFFNPPKSYKPMITRSYEQEIFRMEQSKYIYHIHSFTKYF